MLIAENGLEREWQMTGLDIAVEFGCVATFDLLCELGEAHPHAIKSIEYADVSHEDCRVLCMRNMGNRPQAHFDAERALDSLRLC